MTLIIEIEYPQRKTERERTHLRHKSNITISILYICVSLYENYKNYLPCTSSLWNHHSKGILSFICASKFSMVQESRTIYIYIYIFFFKLTKARIAYIFAI
eukprot:GHVL01019556.1.p1 GENE.GHVL01019556.1~~GHVL01019556.1.p1  ORF type:complete len:101 (-),score=10.00 GHVL01019556.1:617-919(-)